jgi:hypothetical protein
MIYKEQGKVPQRRRRRRRNLYLGVVEGKQQVDTSAHPTKDHRMAIAKGDGVTQKPGTRDRLPLKLGRAYERFWELPVVFVIAVLWMLGVVLLGSIALALYLIGWGVLVPLVAGAV